MDALYEMAKEITGAQKAVGILMSLTLVGVFFLSYFEKKNMERRYPEYILVASIAAMTVVMVALTIR